MGSIIIAQCPCGFIKDDLFVGAGMMNYGTSEFEPALCMSCGHFQACDRMARRPRCKKCQGPVRFYDTSGPRLDLLTEDEPQDVGSTVQDPTQPLSHQGRHLCPRCKEMRMDFLAGGMWD